MTPTKSTDYGSDVGYYMEYLPCSTSCDNSPNHIRQLGATSSSKNNASPLMYISFCVQYEDCCHYAKLSFIHVISGTGRNTVIDFLIIFNAKTVTLMTITFRRITFFTHYWFLDLILKTHQSHHVCPTVFL